MDEVEFRELLAARHELPGVEFKSGGPRTDKALLAKVAKAAMAMANRRGGGKIVVGIREDGDVLVEEGVATADLDSWLYDAVVGAVAKYADPYIEIQVERLTVEGKHFIVIAVEEFQDVPVLCKRGFETDRKTELRDGACYVRRRGRTETTEIPNHSEMRELLDLAVEKGVRRFLQTAGRAGVDISSTQSATSASAYEHELEDFES